MDVQFHNGKILHGDVLDRLKDIPDKSVDVIITSPPYWGLRDYKVEGQLGLEPDFRDHLKTMRLIMDQLKRVLKDTGTCWVNYGDTYAGGTMHSDWQNVDEKFDSKRMQEGEFKGISKIHIQAKSRYGIPERFYIQCIDDGWLARNHIPWYKSNSMPQSVKDRFTNKWESIFFFAKKQKYYFNLDPVRERTATYTKPFNLRVRENITGLAQMKLGDQAWTATEEELLTHNKSGEKKYLDNDGNKYEVGSNARRLGMFRNKENLDKKQDNTIGPDGKPIPTYKGFNDRWKKGKWQQHYDLNGNCYGCGQHFSKHTVSERAKGSMSEAVKRSEDIVWCNPRGKNPGDVFFINPKPFPEAHFATFPIELPTKILKCACPTKVCVECGHIPEPIKKATEDYQKILDAKPWKNKGEYDHLTKGSGLNSIPDFTHDYSAEYITVGFTKCECNSKYRPGVVLDPFFGAGTVAVAAEELHVDWLGIELNEKYIEMCKKRLSHYNSMRLDEFV